MDPAPQSPCPICGGAAGEVVLEGPDRLGAEAREFCVRGCATCGHAFTDPVPDDLAAHYPDEDYYAYRAARDSAAERLRLALIVRVVYGRIARRGGGRILDVGCGAGRLLRAFGRRGWECSGVEPSAGGAEAARASGLDVHTGTLADAPWPPGSFDAVVFNHSLEHVPDPVADLARVRDLLAPDGLLGVTVPNFGSWQRRRFGAAWLQLDLPRHLHHFTEQSLREACGRAGLRPLSVRTHSMMASLPTSLQYAHLGRVRLGGRTGRIAAYALYPPVAATDLIVEGDCLNLIARKVG